MGNQFSSVAQSSPTLYYPMDCSIMGNSKLLNSGENMERNVLFSIRLRQGCHGKIKSLKCLYDKLYFLIILLLNSLVTILLIYLHYLKTQAIKL